MAATSNELCRAAERAAALADGHTVAWQDARGRRWRAEVPTAAQLRAYAPTLAAAYNEPAHAALLGNTEVFRADDVITHFATMRGEGNVPVLVFVDDDFVGDADFRNFSLACGHAEFAFLVAAPSAQGRGLGTEMARGLHRWAFATLGLQAVVASVAPENAASLRVFAKLGYVSAPSAVRAVFAEVETDDVLCVTASEFAVVNAR